MVFDSYSYFIFFFLVFFLYKKQPHRQQNILLLVASYVFYSFWSINFLSLILLSTLIDYGCGIQLDKCSNETIRKRWLYFSLLVNLGFLGFFKYYNFFIDSVSSSLVLFGFQPNLSLLTILLPVGISFYTFQTMSYIIDIYYRRLKPTKDFIDFSLFVAFFPQLVAGPIERASALLPQIKQNRKLSSTKFKSGLMLILFGLFKKVVIADNLAIMANPIFDNPSTQGLETLIGIYAFTIQIYCDFSGYTDMARGSARILGFELMPNFNHPYLATSPQDFWRRWHISLSNWLKDYVYIPLGGNKNNKIFVTSRNLMITMLLGGLWHGAATHFVIWGGYQGTLLILHRSLLPGLKLMATGFNSQTWTVIRIFVMFHLTCLGWVIFRAQTMHDVGLILSSLFSNTLMTGLIVKNIVLLSFLTIPILTQNICQEKMPIWYECIMQNVYIKINAVLFMILMILFWSSHEDIPFIYFQF